MARYTYVAQLSIFYYFYKEINLKLRLTTY